MPFPFAAAFPTCVPWPQPSQGNRGDQSLEEYVEDEDYVRVVGKRFAAWLEEQA